MLISTAYAQSGGGAEGFMAFLPLILIFVVFYFLLIRPQQRKVKQHREMLSAVRRGDRVVTGGGIMGTVIKIIGDDELIVEIADGVRVRVARSMLANVLSKSEPVQERPRRERPQRERAERKGGRSGKEKAAPAVANDDVEDYDDDYEEERQERPARAEGGRGSALKRLLEKKPGE